MKIKPSQLLRLKSHWTQDEYARSKLGNKVDPESRMAVCWCLNGALFKCFKTEQELDEAYNTINDVLKEKGYCHGLINWNDESGRKHSEVVALLKKAGY